jgi:glycosyltransferase involved in cell wall biosynthesis
MAPGVDRAGNAACTRAADTGIRRVSTLKPLRILTLCYEFPPVGGGGARVAHGLATQFVRDGHHVHLLTLGYGSLPDQEIVDGVRLIRVRGWRARQDIARPHELASYLWAVRAPLRRLLQTQQFDIVHMHFLFPDGLLTLLVPELRNLPVVVTVHGSDVPGFNPDRFGLLHRLLHPLWRRVTRRVDRIVCPSNFIAALLRERAPWADPVIIPNGIDIDVLHADRPREMQILAVSRLFERKGIQDLIGALTLTTCGLPAQVVGTGPYRPQLEKSAAPLGARIRLLGWLDNGSAELRDLYETSELFVFPSRAENFPVVLLEAMAAGMAIIATDIPSCREVLADAAVLVPAADRAALAGAIDRLAADSAHRQYLQRSARRRLEENFSWPAISRQYLEIFERCCAARRAWLP